MRPPRPRGVRAVRSRLADRTVGGVFHDEESGRRRAQARGRGWRAGRESAAWVWSWRAGAEGDLDHEQCRGSSEGAGDDPASTRVQLAAASTLRRPGLGRRVNRPWVLGVVVAVACCCVLLGLERAHDLLGGRRSAGERLESVAGVARLVGLELGKRRAVDREVVGEAERERGEILLRAASQGRRGRGLSGLALFAASASVLERPRPIGAWGDRSIRSSAVVSHHRHPTPELYHHHLALDCFIDG